MAIPELVTHFETLATRYRALASFEPQVIEATTGAYMKEKNITPKALLHPMRIALTGTTVSPGIYDLLSLAEKELTVKRLQQASAWIKSSKP